MLQRRLLIAIACVGLASRPLLREVSMQPPMLPVRELLPTQCAIVNQIRVSTVPFAIQGRLYLVVVH